MFLNCGLVNHPYFKTNISIRKCTLTCLISMINEIIWKIRGLNYGIRVDMASQGNLNYYERQCVR